MITEKLAARDDKRRLLPQLLLLSLFWTLILGGMVYWVTGQTNREMLELARLEARANFQKDQAFRAWATKHGGIYVPVTERTQPSPFLQHLPERDITTPSGRKLTLMNPAFMLRQMMEDFNELYGVKGRLSSLWPLNPINTPDAWEAAALRSFEDGIEEAFEVTEIGGKPYLRLMRPMMIEDGCLKCHDHQGFSEEEVAGGVGVSVPLERYYAVGTARNHEMWGILSTVWLLGMGSILVAGWRGWQRIRERISYENQIWHQANYDPLTKLSNRNLFMDRLEHALAFARRENRQLALMYIDVDRFKDINDTQGHDVGDRLLQQVAERLQASVRKSDTVSRIGGDEFTIILSELAHQDSAIQVARKIIADLSDPFNLDGYQAHLSASIGITQFPFDGDDSTTLLRNADTAMYQAKSDGRNTYRYFTPEMNRLAQARVGMETALRKALERREFVLHYQPVFDIMTGRLAGAEALVRWQRPEWGMVPPHEFIKTAEESGAIIPLGEWVARQAASDLSLWHKTGLPLGSLSINVSTVQFRAAGFRPFMENLLAENPLLTDRFNLEITESLFLAESADLAEIMEALRRRGMRIAIDDFGTGYSSLSYLKRFPVDLLKIDRSFIREVITDHEDATLCEAIIAMAHHLGLQVVAEGVETVKQLAFLQAQGCDQAQGYYFSRPLPVEEFTAFLQKTFAQYKEYKVAG